MLCIADRVVGAKIRSEFMREPQVIVHPLRAEVGIAQQELGLEPIECHALEIGLGVVGGITVHYTTCPIGMSFGPQNVHSHYRPTMQLLECFFCSEFQKPFLPGVFQISS